MDYCIKKVWSYFSKRNKIHLKRKNKNKINSSKYLPTEDNMDVNNVTEMPSSQGPLALDNQIESSQTEPENKNTPSSIDQSQLTNDNNMTSESTGTQSNSRNHQKTHHKKYFIEINMI